MEKKQNTRDARLDTLKAMAQRENVVDAIYHFGVDCAELPIRITRSIPLSAYSEMLRNIVESVWDDGDVYNPHMRSLVERLYVYFYYTDLPMTAMDMELLDRVCGDDELFRFVTGMMIDDMYVLDDEVGELIDWEQRRKLHRASNEMADTVTAFVAHLDTLLTKVEEGLSVPNDPKGAMDLRSLIKTMETLASKDEGEIAQGVLAAQQARSAAKGKRRSVKKAPNIEMIQADSTK